ncbi:hypothetical protein NHF46_00310 [Arthrobacter alpinus]|nr:hypothetical protein [Arthrobacter alpinus]
MSFANGERYVGQSFDVVNRFSAHRRRWDDITHIAFRAFVAEDLNFREREILAAIEVRGHRVRNLDLAGRPGGDSLLDVVMEEQAQAEWLVSDGAEPTDAPRYVEGARRAGALLVLPGCTWRIEEAIYRSAVESTETRSAAVTAAPRRRRRRRLELRQTVGEEIPKGGIVVVVHFPRSGRWLQDLQRLSRQRLLHPHSMWLMTFIGSR